MTTRVADAATALESALAQTQVDGQAVPVHRDPGADLQTPAIVLGPPALAFEAISVGPTSARFLVYAVVDASEFAVERLWTFVEAVAAAVDVHCENGVVTQALPVPWTEGATELPSYEITVEVGLL